uniref:Tetraspanin n=1 Tax=Sphenodon punctatus TaxID=8508 RepID=A0A8D0GDA5_SPHPU
MGRRHWVRAAKCQLLVTSLFVTLLGLAVTILIIVTHYGAHFTVISEVSFEINPYRTFHNTVFYSGICLGMILVLAALLSAVATLRESECLTATGFFCFTIVFCALVQAAFWRYSNSTEVEDAMMDVYDFVYEEVRRNSSSIKKKELVCIHETFLCCGKKSPFGKTGGIENEMCSSELIGAAREDCLQEIQVFLRKHMDFVFMLVIITIIFMVYKMMLTSFLWFSIRFSNSLDRKGKYSLSER